MEEAQSYVKQVDELFIQGKRASPEQFREARRLLFNARQSIDHLLSIMNTNVSLSELLQSNQFSIIAQVNIIHDQMDRLLSDLKKNIQGDYRSLNDALSKVQGLITE